MSDVIGRGVIEVSADSTKLRAGIDSAKRSIASLGEANKDASTKSAASIDRYIKRLEVQNATIGKSARETELYKLSLRGASDAQLKAADSALKLSEAHEKGAVMGRQIAMSFVAIGTAAAAGLISAAVAIDQLVKKAGDFQDMAEKTGDSAQNIASLAVAAGTAGVQMETIVSASTKLTKNLTGVDDESKEAGAALAALGLNLKDFKQLKPADQIEAIGKAMNSFEEGAGKSAVAMALFGKSGADLLPFLKEIGAEGGRQVILTEQQIRQADEYADKQAKLRTEIGLYAQSIAAQMLPAISDLSSALKDSLLQLIGVDKSASDLANNKSIAEFADAAVDALAFILTAGQSVVRIFQSIGTALGANAAIAGELAKGNIQSALDTAKQARAEINGILTATTISQNVAARRESRQKDEAAAIGFGLNEQLIGGTTKAALKFDGKVGTKKAGTAGQEAKAQLAFDLDQIKKASDAILNTQANAEKIMEAQRQAGLLNEQEYYAAKRGFMIANSAEQEKELQREIARLQQEKLAGKDKLDNERKIVDAQAKLSKIRENVSTNIQVLEIQQKAAIDKVARSYEEARISAEAYLATLTKQNGRSIASFGMSDRERDKVAGQTQIEDRYQAQRDELENNKRLLEFEGKFTEEARRQYDTRLAIINEFQAKASDQWEKYYDQLIAKDQDWESGAIRSLKNYYDESQNIYKGIGDLVTKSFQGMEDALVEFATTGKLDFKSLADSIIADMARIIIKQQITGPLANWLSGGGGNQSTTGGGSSGSATDFLGSIIGLFSGRAIGGPVSAGGMYRVNEKGPELLNVAGKQYLMMGNQPGSVDANAPTGQRTVLQTINFVSSGSVDRRTQDQVASAAMQGLRRATARNS